MLVRLNCLFGCLRARRNPFTLPAYIPVCPPNRRTRVTAELMSFPLTRFCCLGRFFSGSAIEQQRECDRLGCSVSVLRFKPWTWMESSKKPSPLLVLKWGCLTGGVADHASRLAWGHRCSPSVSAQGQGRSYIKQGWRGWRQWFWRGLPLVSCDMQRFWVTSGMRISIRPSS